jgi:putative Mg2+ transporter-C (MgtC) family protein
MSLPIAGAHAPYASILASMSGAMVLGWLVGYERYFKGRAAGSQVYCIVCVTSCAVTLLAGFPSLWYWSHGADSDGGDPTKVIGSILTGIGFLGAGIIVKSGLNVRGLTTAASIWGSSAIGILVGAGFFPAAVGLTALSVACTSLVPWIEQRLPARGAISTSLRFRDGFKPSVDDIHAFVATRGLSIPPESVSIDYDGRRFELDCLMYASAGVRSGTISRVATELSELPDVESFRVTHSVRA